MNIKKRGKEKHMRTFYAYLDIIHRVY